MIKNMLLTKTVKVKWGTKNKKWYEEKGYEFTKMSDEFEIRVEDSTKSNNSIVKVKCDECGKLINMRYYVYQKYVHEDNEYYCQKCANIIFGIKKRKKSVIKNGKSFEQWCYDNLSKEKAKEVLLRWDYELNKCKPNEIPYGTKKKYYFKCPGGLHDSELKCINSFTSGGKGVLDCHKCNSFAQWCIDNNREDVLELWDYGLNECSPCNINKGARKNYYFKCQEGIHESEFKNISSFTSGKQKNISCNKCNSFENWCIKNNKRELLDL